MSDPIANRTLELACTVGSIGDAAEALDDGADVNCNGGSPLFQCILARHRPLIRFLLEHGADAENFLSRKRLALVRDQDDLVEELIACAPHNPRDVKPEMIATIDTAIRSRGVEYLLSELDWDNAVRFRDSLDAIGAGTSHRCVAEFLQWARSESATRRDALEGFLTVHQPTVTEYRERYLSSGENLVALANEFASEDASDGEADGE